MENISVSNTLDLLMEAKKQGVKLFLENDKLRFTNTGGGEPDKDLIDNLRAHRNHLIAYLKAREEKAQLHSHKANVIQPRLTNNRIPLSYEQQQLWFINQLGDDSAYYMTSVNKLEGVLNAELFELAVRQLVERHEVLRTIYREDNGVPYQEIIDSNSWELQYISIEAIGGETHLEHYIHQVLHQPFRIHQEHPFRIHLVKCDETTHVLILVIHHIACDGTSVPIFFDELATYYHAIRTSVVQTLPALPLQYADYAVWQRSEENEKHLKEKVAYWKNQLHGVSSLRLPHETNTARVQSNAGKDDGFLLEAPVANEIKQICLSLGVTPFMFLLGAIKVLLHKYSGQSDICVGTPVANRSNEKITGLIGYFTNTIALRSHLDSSISFATYLEIIKAVTLGALDRQDVPFEKVVASLGLKRDATVNPVFQVMFSYNNQFKAKAGDVFWDNLKISALNHTSKTAQFDLTFDVAELPDGLLININYKTGLFSEARINALKVHLQYLLKALVKNTSVPIGQLSIVTPAEMQLLKTYNQPLPIEQPFNSIVNLFDEQVKLYPEKEAVVTSDDAVCYRALNEAVTQKARYLKRIGVKPSDGVGVYMEPSISMITTLLAILKAGAAYIPIDISYPKDRISFILEDAQISTVVTTAALHNDIPNDQGTTILLVESVMEPIVDEAVLPAITGDQIAYVLYTSGSTGKPKGVMVNHLSLSGKLLVEASLLQLNESVITCMLTSFGFDVSLLEIFLPLIVGGTLVIPAKEALLEPLLLTDILLQQKVTIIQGTPGFLYPLINAMDAQKAASLHLKTICSGGESLTVKLVAEVKHKLPHVQLNNHYGPTEVTIDAVVFENVQQFDSNIIGKPMLGTQAFIVNDNGQLVPPGIAGELWIAGGHLAVGYFNQPELTAQKFGKYSLLDGEPAVACYKTGDLARWTMDGLLEYLGRKDSQVKIRGYRIEPGEIQNIALLYNGVQQCAVTAVADSQAHKRLVMYLVLTKDITIEDVQEHLKKQLPAYMIPSYFMEVAAIPLNANGKIDFDALPQPEYRERKAAYQPPQNDMQAIMATIWGELLGIEQVGIHDNFFELGGDSIITIQVVSRAQKQGIQLKPKDIFDKQTIAELCSVLSDKTSESMAEQGILTGTAPLLPIQQVWFLEGDYAEMRHFNQDMLLNLDKSLSQQSVHSVVQAIINAHDALRFTYKKENDEWIQYYSDSTNCFFVEDLSHIERDNLAAAITRICEIYQQDIHLDKGGLSKWVLIQTPESSSFNRLFVVAHHLAVDGVSWRIIMDDLQSAIRSVQSGKVPEFGYKTNSYRQFGNALAAYSKTGKTLSTIPYWVEMTAGYKPLPVDKALIGASLVKDVANYGTSLGVAQTSALLKLANQAYGTDINELLLAALAKTINEWSQHHKLLVGLEGHGREEVDPLIDISRTVGWFTNLYPVALTTQPGDSEDKLIKSVKEQMRAIPDKGMGFGALRFGHPSASVRDQLASVQWDVVFNYLGQLDNIVATVEDSLSMATESRGRSQSIAAPFTSRFEINAVVSNGELNVQWSYNQQCYYKETVAMLANRYLDNLAQLIAHCSTQKKRSYTPSDFGMLGKVSIEDLDLFLKEMAQGKYGNTTLEAIYPLSPMQEGMLFHGLYNKTSTAYVEQLSFDLFGPDIEALRKAWQFIAINHTVLRTAFFHNALAIPFQAVFKEVVIPFEIVDYTNLATDSERDQQVQSYMQQDIARGFQFDEVPLMRITLLKKSADCYTMIWTSHHLLFDGWSIPVILKELLAAYEKYIQQQQPSLMPLDNYKKYIDYLSHLDAQAEEDFWKNYLVPLEAPTHIPFLEHGAERNKGGGIMKEADLVIDETITTRIKQFAQTHLLTINTVMQSVWAFLLHKYTGNQAVAFGVTVSGRPADKDFAQQGVGLYINTIPLLSEIQADEKVVHWMLKLQKGNTVAREFQYTALNKIQKWSGLKGDIFDTTLAFENFPVEKELEGEWALKIGNIQSFERNNYLLSLTIAQGRVLGINFRYNGALLEERYVSQMKQHFEHVLLQVIDQPNAQMGDLQVQSAVQASDLIATFNNTQFDYGKPQSLTQQWVQQVRQSPDKIAIVFEGQASTYQDIDGQSTRLASLLITKGVKKGNHIGVCLERSPDMIIAFLAILKCGAVYVPIDPDFPSSRVNYLLEDAGICLVISKVVYNRNSMAFESLFEEQEGVLVLDMEEFWNNAQYPALELPHIAVHPLDPAYIMYTSGTTGNPKGIVVSHQNISKLVAEPGPIAINANDKVLQWSNAVFDGSTYDIYCTLLNGATLYLIQKEVARDAIKLIQFIEAEKISVCFITTAMFNGLVDYKVNALTGLRKVLFGGQQASIPHVNKAFEATGPGVIVHVYGPTETTVYASYYPIDVAIGETIPIGKPLTNTSLYICDAAGRIEGIGCVGEIYVGGQGVAIGYLNNATLTEQQFLANPHQPAIGERMYKTGDYGRLTPDGMVTFVGRKDDQVKVRGYRIELGEVEAAIQRAPHVKQCTVTTVDDGYGNKKLIGYVVGDERYSHAAVQAFLQKELPDYMIPAIMLELDHLPLTINGKVDKKALPDPTEHYQQTDNYQAPQNEVQAQLVAVWERILSHPKIGVTDNFFSIGGDSIIAIRAISGIKKALHVEVSISDFYQSPTILELEKLVLEKLATSGGGDPVKKEVLEYLDTLGSTILEQMPDHADVEAVFPMSDIQKGMIFASQMNDGLGVYHDQMMYLLPYVDIDIYQRALSLLVEKHAMLRTTFNLDDYSEGVQIVHRNWPVTIDYHDLDAMSATEQQEFLREYVAAERKNPFNVKEGPLWRVSVFKTSSQYMVYLFQFHHAILDGWSFASLNTEWNNLCHKLMVDPLFKPASLGVSYRDGVVESLIEKRNEKSIEFWKREMDQYTRFDIFEREDVLENKTVRYDPAFFDRLKIVAGKLNITPKTLCLGAYLFSLRMFTYHDDLTVGLVSNLRPLHEDGDKVLGCFLNSVPFRNDLGKYKQVTWKEYLLELDEKLRKLKGPDRLTLLEIARHTGENSSEGNPFFDVIFNFIDFHVYNKLEAVPDEKPVVLEAEEAPKEANLELLSHESTNTFLDISVSTTGGLLMIYYTLRKKLKGNLQLSDICNYYHAFLEAMVEDPFAVIAPHSLMPAREKEQLLRMGTGKMVPYAEDQNVLYLFEQQVALQPNAPAIGIGQRWLTYTELNQAADLLAAYLQQKYIQPTTIAVCMDRSPELIIAMLAAFKLGAAYLPIDKQYPRHRIAYMMEESKAEVVVTMQKEHSLFNNMENVVCMDMLKYNADDLKAYQSVSITPASTAYIIFTSGSTGRPKGVSVTHGALANLIQWHCDAYEVDATSIATTMAGIGFDAFGWEIWPYLSCGAKLVVLTDEQRMLPDQWLPIFTSEKVTHSFIPTALVSEFLLISSGKQLFLKYALTGGDALPPVDLSNQSFRLVNNYGPTENTVVATYYVLPKHADVSKPPIGIPISNVQLYLLNQSGDLVPAGVAGELYVGGKSLASGYIGQAALTAERFVANPFGGSQERLYKTGDLVRWLPDGNLEYLGRTDEQIQLRGYRIELGEIEQAIADTGLVQQCIVMAKESNNKKYMVAYFTIAEGNQLDSLQAVLQEKLPQYMIPSVFVQLAHFPLTANGKIDRKALPEPNTDATERNNYEAPRNEVEAQLIKVWENLLNKSSIGIHDNFFDLGGDSIITIQVCSRAKAMGYILKPRDIFQNQTVAQLAKVALAGHSAIMGEQGLLQGQAALLPVQQWFLEQPFDGMHHFNQDMLLLLSKDITPVQVEQAVGELLVQHDALRLVVSRENGEWQQAYGELRNDFFSVETLAAIKVDGVGEAITSICNNYQQQFDLNTGKMFHAVLIETPVTEPFNRLFMVAHHLSVDAVSWRIIVDCLKANIAALQNGVMMEQSKKGTSYREWGEALMQYAISPKVAIQLPYWKTISQRYMPLKVDKQRAIVPVTTNLKSVSVSLNEVDTTLLLTEVNQAYGTEINDILLSALAYTIAQWDGSNAVVIGMEGHGREESIVTGTDISSTVGWFTNVYPIGLLVNGAMELPQLIKTVKEQLRSLPDKGMGFGALKYLHPEAAVRKSLQGCAWDIVFNYLGQFENAHDAAKPQSLDVASESRGITIAPDTPFNTRLELTASVINKQLVVSWAFTEMDYYAATVEQLAQHFIHHLAAIIAHCTSQKERSYTPADYGLSGKIEMEELDAFLNTASQEDKEIFRF